jgi:hypothetical protein
MPTNITKIHELVKLKLNKLDSNANYDLPPAFIDLLLWEALNEYIDIFYSGSDKQLKLGFESTQQRLDMLRDFVVTYPDEPLLVPNVTTTQRDSFTVSVFNLNNLSRTCKHYLRGTVINNCNNRLKIDIVKHDHLDYKLNDEYNKPSSNWGRAIGLIDNKALKVYSDVALTSLEISYLKTPLKPFFGGYNTLEFLAGDLTAPSAASAQINVELSDEYSNTLTDILVMNISSYIGDYSKSQELKNKIMTNN